MNFDDVCETLQGRDFPAVGEDAHPDRTSVAELRSRLRDGLARDQLLIDCIRHELRLVERAPFRSGLVPFFILPGRGVRFAFGYWPPRTAPGPHEHTAWTVTAVVSNQLEVVTYDRAASYRRRELITKNQFSAGACQVGFIYEPAIHAPMNTTSDWTLSLHIISPRDGEPIAGEDPILPWPRPYRGGGPRREHPYTRVLRARDRLRSVRVLTRILLSKPLPQARELLGCCFRLGSSATRRTIAAAAPDRFPGDPCARVLARVDPALDLSLRRQPDGWGLHVETPRGSVVALQVNDTVAEALTDIARRPDFDLAALPGDLSSDERGALAEMLEATGIFTRVNA